MTSPTLDFWFEFASTYSYPAAMRIGTVAREAGVVVRWRPFLLGPIFKVQGWDTSPFNIYAAKGRYMWRDLERLCRELDLPFVHPDPFPQNTLLASRVALAAAGEPWFEAYCRSVYGAEFGGGQNIADAGVIGRILDELGVAPAAYLAAAQTPEVKERLKFQTEDAQRLGIFGAPSFTTSDGELFWGNDRLEAAVAWASRLART
jgi:2-hydroxychromene-2-carboxylate isomerase